MAEEKYENLAQGVLASSCLGTDTTISVTESKPFPTSGDFSIRVESVNGAAAELMRVTGVSGSGPVTFTVTRALSPTTATAFAAGAYVTEVITKESLDNLMANAGGAEVDVYASRPAAVAKHTFFAEDTAALSVADAVPAWQEYGPLYKIALPPQTGWSWVNQSTASATINGHIAVSTPSGTSGWAQYLYNVTPPGTYSFKVGVAAIAANFCFAGIAVYNSGNTKGYLFGLSESGSIIIGRLTSPTVFASFAYNTGMPTGFGSRVDYQVEVSASNIYFRISGDGGLTWLEVFSESLASHISAVTAIGAAVNSTNGKSAISTILSMVIQ